MAIAKAQLLQFGNSPVIDFGSEVVHFKVCEEDVCEEGQVT